MVVRLSTSILFLTFGLQTVAQSTIDKCELNQSLKSTINSDIDIITETEYNRLRNIYFKSEKVELHKLNSDSLESALVKTFPNVFSLKDSCYTFKSISGGEIKACKLKGSDEKDYSTYEFVNANCNLIQLSIGVYEGWGNIYVNPNTGEAFYTGGDPIYLNCDYLYSHTNYYGDEEISIVNLRDKKYMILNFDGWYTIESFTFQSYFVFKLKSYNCRDKVKYLNVLIN